MSPEAQRLMGWLRIDDVRFQREYESKLVLSGHVFIYALVDPRDMTVRYIGKTVSPEDRLLAHLDATQNNGPLRRWILELSGLGRIPEMVTLEKCPGLAWEDAERYWIAWFRSRSAELYNIEAGGTGKLARPWEIGISRGPVTTTAARAVSAFLSGRIPWPSKKKRPRKKKKKAKAVAGNEVQPSRNPKELALRASKRQMERLRSR